ncbi:MAG TPA: hypothetical protein VH041_10675 [Caldimonas sp.]|jgi:hypothetical protein|nr:hypothetical protein [Caldimonas sp.]HEX4234762.1 hypothetical protein [Caldimonas sp.]
MGFTVLFLLLLVTAGWWLHSRWSALRDAQAARREAELMVVFEARSKIKPVVATPAASDFYPTLPEQDASPLRAVPQSARRSAAE